MFFPGYYHWHLFDVFVMNSRLVEQPANTTTVLFFSFSSFVPQTATLEIDNHLLTCSQWNAKLVPKNKQAPLKSKHSLFTFIPASNWSRTGSTAVEKTPEIAKLLSIWFNQPPKTEGVCPHLIWTKESFNQRGQLQKSGGGFFLHDHKILNTGLTKPLNYPQFLIAKRKQTA